jgi:hypothetical protein
MRSWGFNFVDHSKVYNTGKFEIANHFESFSIMKMDQLRGFNFSCFF